jgi:hypothetical protein
MPKKPSILIRLGAIITGSQDSLSVINFDSQTKDSRHEQMQACQVLI